MKKVLFLYLIFGLSIGFAQILKDTTLPYGINTIQTYKFEDEIYFRGVKHQIDTTFLKYMSYESTITANNFYQNLGTLGSTSRPIFFDRNHDIGLDHGFDAFKQLQVNASDQVFYSTRSPMSVINYLQGTTGENKLLLNLATPITKRSGLGIDIGRFTSNKIAGRSGNRNTDRFSSTYSLALYFNYLSKNGRYKIFGASTLFWNNQAENGGFAANLFKNREDLFDSLDYAKPKLEQTNLFTNMYKNDVRIYQNYRLTKDSTIGIFHDFGFTRCTTNVMLRAAQDKFDSSFVGKLAYYDSRNTTFAYRFDKFENRVGLTGKRQRYNYAIYLKSRQLIGNTLLTSKEPPPDTSFRQIVMENYGGADLNYVLIPEKLSLGLFVEQKLSNKVFESFNEESLRYSLKKDLIYDLTLRSKMLDFGVLYKKVSPTILQTSLFHNNFRWAHNWADPTNYLQLYLKLNKRLGKQEFKLNLDLSNVSNAYYLDSNKSINMAEKVLLSKAGFDVNLTFWKIHFDNHIIVAQSNDTLAFSVPRYVYDGKIYFGSKFYTVRFNLGLELKYTDAFYAYNYNPEINSFSAQSKQKSYGVPVINPFINGQIQNFSFWMKYTFVNQYFNSPSGYFVTPDYIGLPPTFVFGVNWFLFE